MTESEEIKEAWLLERRLWETCPKIIHGEPTEEECRLLNEYCDAQMKLQKLQGYLVYFPFSPLYVSK